MIVIYNHRDLRPGAQGKPGSEIGLTDFIRGAPYSTMISEQADLVIYTEESGEMHILKNRYGPNKKLAAIGEYEETDQEFLELMANFR